MRILLIEDEKALARPLKEHLEADRHIVEWFCTLDEADAALRTLSYDVVLLDLQLPDGDGLDFLSKLRAKAIRTPILILTARDKVSDRIEGLNRGADDYVIKPFDLDEVKARIHTVCRRSANQFAQTVQLHDVVVNLSDHTVMRAEQPVRLTAKEWGVFETLLRRKPQIVPKESLEAAIYDYGEEVESNAIEAHISRLRTKLGKDLIATHRGLGYALTS
ncbi:MAG: DNA-binding response regulator [Roseobacter sp.]|jgi:two-component system OmpR family response regulator|uniref:Two-component system, OmpR family, response regulator n=1 Tax=Sulfitobacter pontiacus TaxID=60137 RepID=A0A1H2YYG4_9RHOB|nr:MULTISPECIES: response regulator transcription factor [Sulfitobacter]MBG64710.1 DNA-binding response regulator [Roseobacter sp.]HBM41001.1 DNA-binding response regulator [Sulfitobacter sp.]KAJ30584.1 transcriptional regulator [Sulfitobacter pontiacus 3SOLIMAR09]QPO09150.1 response regulator transcription factor [Sulfitobacter sp. B30-2]SDX10156.1 two-component system, OmpR family, response regulator [Sulfitobacter pontiacus]|tara:strand:+ start:2858 stop:3514 length:657 start_codon:yes stop_codon:yes gene_type:complete